MLYREVKMRLFSWSRRKSRALLFAGAACSTICFLPVVARTWIHRSSAAMETSRLPSPALVLMAARLSNDDSSIDLGTITAGTETEKTIRLRNSSNSPIEIHHVRTSCPCLTIVLTDRTIAPQQTAYAIVRIHMGDEPEFTGGLCPEMQLLDAAGRVLFLRTVRVKVVVAGRTDARNELANEIEKRIAKNRSPLPSLRPSRSTRCPSAKTQASQPTVTFV
ncbi:MAG: DUF1573 domain-containing protein [Candidatus Saccharimonadales bacterium]